MIFDTAAFNTIVGVVLALAAILAYLLQRSRYLREIEPDLELTWDNEIRVSNMGSTMTEFWAYYIDVRVENKSKNHAQDMLFSVNLEVFPERGKPRVLSSKYLEIPRMHQAELLAGRNVKIPIYVGLNYARGIYEQFEEWGKPIEVKSCGFFTTITLEYYSNRELLLLLLLPPWNLGRKKYKRKLFVRYGFELKREKDKSYYIARNWEFPNILLSDWDKE